ncbi:hypothetical protein [Spiroplasma ixodetis]|uniref:hypothetical protein n=1 Tax=Spiroplasma ixodetis TaxID=2141 RepID=UPI00249338B2|nr:hypothetical protein [Spiroplasma ixodetis]
MFTCKLGICSGNNACICSLVNHGIWIRLFSLYVLFLILSHKCWEKPIYELLPTFLNKT